MRRPHASDRRRSVRFTPGAIACCTRPSLRLSPEAELYFAIFLAGLLRPARRPSGGHAEAGYLTVVRQYPAIMVRGVLLDPAGLFQAAASCGLLLM